MTRWAALPTRQLGEALSNIDYRVEDGSSGKRHVATFRHRDNRIWDAKIVNDPQYIAGDSYPYMAEVSSAGCRSWVFLAPSLEQSKRTVSRFSNLAVVMYQRLIADASGTNDFPIPGQVGVFRMTLSQQVRDIRGRSAAAITRHSEVTGVARYDGTQIIVFPRAEEIRELLSGVCSAGTIALVPTGINEISDASDQPSFLVGQRTPYSGIAAPQVGDDELNAALNRLRNDTVDTVMSRLHSGDYTTTARHERTIDFFDEDEQKG